MLFYVVSKYGTILHVTLQVQISYAMLAEEADERKLGFGHRMQARVVYSTKKLRESEVKEQLPDLCPVYEHV